MSTKKYNKEALASIRGNETMDELFILPNGMTAGEFAFQYVQKTRSLRSTKIIRRYQTFVQQFTSLH